MSQNLNNYMAEVKSVSGSDYTVLLRGSVLPVEAVKPKGVTAKVGDWVTVVFDPIQNGPAWIQAVYPQETEDE